MSAAENTQQILLVEDNPGDVRLIMKMLEDQHIYQLATADSLTSAFEQLAQRVFHLVLLDLGLPESKGLDTLKTFCSKFPELPTVVLTGLNDEETAIESLRIGAQDFLQKGKIDPAILSRSIRYSLERAETLGNLRESEERWRSLTAYSDDYIWTCDTDLRFISINKIQQDLPPDLIMGRSLIDFIPPVYKESAELCFHNVQQTGEPGSYETEFTRATDTCPSQYETFVNPIKKNGKVIGFACRSMNITERNKTEKEKQELQRQMQHAQKLESLGVLAGGIAHDFNNILMAILGNADLALMDVSTANPAYSNIKAIETAARRAAELSKQMLAYSGKGKFLIEKISLNEAVEEMTHILEVSISKKAVIKYHHADGLPLVEADATQIRQIIMNLVTNASDAIDKTSGVISIRTGAMDCNSEYLSSTYINESLGSGQYVYVEVTDTGCGMSKETQKKLFDPFFTTKFTGRGLGLSAVLGIIRGHKGAIKIYSELGKGTSIKVLFPACRNEDESLHANYRNNDDLWLGSGTVLIVDDEETILSVGKQMLERMGFDVLTAADGRIATDIFRKNYSHIRLVILDLVMPHLDGEETFRELRRIQKDVCVILSSGYNEQEVTQRFAGKSLAGFIHKPYIYKELVARIKEVLESCH